MSSTSCHFHKSGWLFSTSTSTPPPYQQALPHTSEPCTHVAIDMLSLSCTLVYTQTYTDASTGGTHPILGRLVVRATKPALMGATVRDAPHWTQAAGFRCVRCGVWMMCIKQLHPTQHALSWRMWQGQALECGSASRLIAASTQVVVMTAVQTEQSGSGGYGVRAG